MLFFAWFLVSAAVKLMYFEDVSDSEKDKFYLGGISELTYGELLVYFGCLPITLIVLLLYKIKSLDDKYSIESRAEKWLKKKPFSKNTGYKG